VKAIEISSPIPAARAYEMGECSVMIERHQVKERGILVPRWHLSISHPRRLPKYYEVKQARYQLLPDDVTLAMLFPPQRQFVNVHPNCLHLYEIDNEAD
jgi:hypothetical protein